MIDVKRAGRSRLFLALIAVFALIGLAYILYDLYTVHADLLVVTRAQKDLIDAMARWDSQGIDDYRISVQGFVPLNCLVSGEITVRDNQLEGVQMRENPLIEDSRLLPVDRSEWERPGCLFEDLTILNMFERLRLDLGDPRTVGRHVLVRFDERLGFITEYRLGRPGQANVLGPAVSECCTWFEFSGFSEIEQ